jgi:signal transduction histidine kinase
MTPARGKSRISGDASWLPLAFVIVALAVLLITPILVDWRIAGLRREMDDRSHARLLLNDLEAAGATQALIASRPPRPTGQTDTIAQRLGATLVAGAAEDERELDSLLRTASPESRADFAAIAAIERAWRNARPGDAARVSAKGGDGADPLLLFVLAERLDKRLADRLDAVRLESRRLQTLDLITAIVLTPIALLSVLAVFIAGRRARRLARRLEREQQALAQSVEAREGLMRGITHDLKNPLGAAAGYADLLLEGIPGGPLAPEQANMVRRIRKLLIESTGTIASLLQLAHDRAKAELRVAAEPVDLMALVREVVEDYRAAAVERGLRLDLESEIANATAFTDAGHVQHILGNLLSNAVKYTPANGHIRVHVGRDEHDDALSIAVCDDGPGIPAQLRDRVFEEFFRAETSTRAGGHGVGLAISRRLARLLGGDLTLGDAPEGGAKFVLRLPLQSAAAAA